MFARFEDSTIDYCCSCVVALSFASKAVMNRQPIAIGSCSDSLGQLTLLAIGMRWNPIQFVSN